MPPGSPIVIVTARNEAERIGATLRALRAAFPGARLVVADDASSDGTPDLALAGGAELIRRGRRHGKGGAASAAAAAVLPELRAEDPPPVLLCDGDLGATAAQLAALVERVAGGECDLAVGSFARRERAGLGLTIGFARWAARNLTGLELAAPISGQRALRGNLLRSVLPFAPRYGMELAMTVDAARAGARVREVELDLSHRATGWDAGGWLHRGGQLRDCMLVWLSRRLRPRR